jgi:hypothetical protein
MVGADRVSMSVQSRRRVPGLRQMMEQPLTQVPAGIVCWSRQHAPADASSRVEQAGDQGPAQPRDPIKPAAPRDGSGHGADAGGAAVGSGRRLGVTAGYVRGRINDGVAGRGPRGVRMADRDEASSRGGCQSRRV